MASCFELRVDDVFTCKPSAEAVIERVGARKRSSSGTCRSTDGYLWPILAPNIGVAFYYCDSRAYSEVGRVLKDFTGTLVSDAWSVYQKFTSETSCSWQLCWMHIRRNFVDAERSNPALAKEALELLAKAISYVMKRWEAATLFIFDGNVPMDNADLTPHAWKKRFYENAVPEHCREAL